MTALLQVAEPRHPYGERPAIVVDASVAAAAVFNEAEFPQAIALLVGRQLLAPHLIDIELVSLALKKQRREGLPLESIGQALALFNALPLARFAVDSAAVLSIADRYALTAYDAAYLWLAGEQRVPLATFDGRLADAARQFLQGPDAAASQD